MSDIVKQTAFCSLLPLRTSLNHTLNHAQPLLCTRWQTALTSRNGCRVHATAEAGSLSKTDEFFEEKLSPETSREIVLAFWATCNEGKFSNATPLFCSDSVYYDTLYPRPFRGIDAIKKHLIAMESALPLSTLRFVLDDIAPSHNAAGARWHAETLNGVQVPFSRGASMYKFKEENGKVKIAEAWDFPETPLKIAGIVLPVASAAAKILNFFKSGESQGTEKEGTSSLEDIK